MALWKLMLAGVVGIAGCRRPHIYTLAELGCGAGAYPGSPVQRGAAGWPEPLLGIAQHAGLHVQATDAATGRAATQLNVWLRQGTQTHKARTNAQGVAEFSALDAGPAVVHAFLFNFEPINDSVWLRAGFRDSLRLQLGRAGNECYIVPDTGRQARRRPTGP